MRGIVTLAAVCWLASAACGNERVIPASTAYLAPDPSGARVNEQDGISRWTNPDIEISWYGEWQRPGTVSACVELALPANQTSQLELSAGESSKQVTVVGDGQPVQRVAFGEFAVAHAGYVSWRLQSRNAAGVDAGRVQALVLSGDGVAEAHFNLKSRRNAASVHLRYPVPAEAEVSAFYCELTGLEDPLWTYYMACGWHRGYFGMQVNSSTERRIIFSVWDSGGEPTSRDRVATADRVTLVDQGPDVFTGDFGNEGTGGHSHLKFLWPTGERQRFLVTARPVDETHTVFSGYYFRPDLREWMLISSWNAPHEGGYLRSLYSFSENFAGQNGHLLRQARYGNQWIRTRDGVWRELTRATFSHDVTGKADRRDRGMRIEQGEFLLTHGGFQPPQTPAGTPFDRPAVGTAPEIPAALLP